MHGANMKIAISHVHKKEVSILFGNMQTSLLHVTRVHACIIQYE